MHKAQELVGDLALLLQREIAATTAIEAGQAARLSAAQDELGQWMQRFDALQRTHAQTMARLRRYEAAAAAKEVEGQKSKVEGSRSKVEEAAVRTRGATLREGGHALR